MVFTVKMYGNYFMVDSVINLFWYFVWTSALKCKFMSDTVRYISSVLLFIYYSCMMVDCDTAYLQIYLPSGIFLLPVNFSFKLYMLWLGVCLLLLSKKYLLSNNIYEIGTRLVILKGQYHHNQSRLSIGHGIGVLV